MNAQVPKETHAVSRRRLSIDRRHGAYCLGMLAAFTSSRLAATSSLKNRSNSATVIGSFSTPIFANRSCTNGNASAFTTSSCSLSTMARIRRIKAPPSLHRHDQDVRRHGVLGKRKEGSDGVMVGSHVTWPVILGGVDESGRQCGLGAGIREV